MGGLVKRVETETLTMKNEILLGMIALLTVSGCSGDDSNNRADAGGVEGIEWLKSCQDDSECGDRECVCNLCTVRCEDDASCQEDDESSVCSRRGSKIYRALCECRDESLAGICLPGCGDEMRCAEGFSCLDSVCLPEGVTLEQDEPEPFDLFSPVSLDTSTACKIEYVNLDETWTDVEYRSFDTDGNILVYARESSEGEAWIETHTYDEEGRQLVYTVDELGDCADVQTYTNEYDVFGNVTGHSRDNDGDGVIDYSETNTYDERCNLLSENVGGSDGSVDMRTTYSYDDEGIPSSLERLFFADGVIESRTTVTYDDEGNPLIEETDEGDDGVIDYRASYTYEDDGWSVTSEGYEGAERVVYFRQLSTYDEDGNLLHSEQDDGADGTIDHSHSHTYDDKGNVLTYEEDGNGDGTIDFRYSYTYNDKGNVLTYEQYSNGDGVVDFRYSYTYDDDGNQLSFEENADGDGVADFGYVYNYSEYGRIQSQEYHANGSLLDQRNFFYDDDGRLARSEMLTPDGTVESTKSYTYECSEEDIIECSPDRALEDPTYNAVCVDPFEEGVQPYSVDRLADPVVLTGDALGPLLGREPDRVVAFRFQDAWERIPVQVDERKTVAYTTIYENNDCPGFSPPAGYDGLVYADESTTVGSDPDPAIDDDDEVVVMLKDAGEAPESYAEPEGVEAGSGVRVDVSERDGGESLGTFYFG